MHDDQRLLCCVRVSHERDDDVVCAPVAGCDDGRVGVVVIAGHIVAIGGGTFWEDGFEDLCLDVLILLLVCCERPCVCFIVIVSGDVEGYCYCFYCAMACYDCVAVDFLLFLCIVDDLVVFVVE